MDSKQQQTPAADRVMSPSEGPLAHAAIPVIEELLRVEKVQVDQGGVRVTKNVGLHTVDVDEELRDFRVDIERRPIGKQLEESALPTSRYEGETLVIPVVEEVLVVEKRFVLVEEVRIKTVRGTHRDTQRVDLRKESVSVERLPPKDAELGRDKPA